MAHAAFMGGRELQLLCDGAEPNQANAADLQTLVDRGLMDLPGFESQSGPFRHCRMRRRAINL
jgi:hypothetical protein